MISKDELLAKIIPRITRTAAKFNQGSRTAEPLKLSTENPHVQEYEKKLEDIEEVTKRFEGGNRVEVPVVDEKEERGTNWQERREMGLKWQERRERKLRRLRRESRVRRESREWIKKWLWEVVEPEDPEREREEMERER